MSESKYEAYRSYSHAQLHTDKQFHFRNHVTNVTAYDMIWFSWDNKIRIYSDQKWIMRVRCTPEHSHLIHRCRPTHWLPFLHTPIASTPSPIVYRKYLTCICLNLPMEKYVLPSPRVASSSLAASVAPSRKELYILHFTHPPRTHQ